MIRVARPGLLTTVQDLGRPGFQQHGVIEAGPMDAVAHRIANLLVGNAPDAAALEITMVGPTLEMRADLLIALTGADFGTSLDDRTVPLWRPFVAPRGSVLAFSGARAGCRACVAVAGGFAVPLVLGSRSTDLIAGIGGVAGRALEAGDTLDTGAAPAAARRIIERIREDPRRNRAAGRSLLPHYTREPVIRVVRGPEHGRFSEATQALLIGEPFEVTPQSNRMGLRLAGAELPLEGAYDLFSSPVAAGTIQVPPSGEPIVLMADHQTIGGYPRIANVIAVDLPLLAQAVPGSVLRFMEVSVTHAQELYLARERDLRIFAEALRLHYA